jgi:hypothetical protein
MGSNRNEQTLEEKGAIMVTGTSLPIFQSPFSAEKSKPLSTVVMTTVKPVDRHTKIYEICHLTIYLTRKRYANAHM